MKSTIRVNPHFKIIKKKVMSDWYKAMPSNSKL
jgi:hypothetical protein